MISVADLTLEKRIPGHYYAKDTYVRGELEMGLLENRRGDRLLALPHTLIQGLYAGLEKETGAASRLVLYNCGRWWGKHFFNRFRDEVTDYYETALVDMKMALFLQALRHCWATYGWGRLALETAYQSQGFLMVETWNSSFARQASGNQRPICALEAGVLAAFFGELAGQELYCLQITCESLGADRNRFLLGLRDRLEPAETWIDGSMDVTQIMTKLSQG